MCECSFEYEARLAAVEAKIAWAENMFNEALNNPLVKSFLPKF